MKSPFPGMDPYLEHHWGDVHTSLITYSRDQLRTQLPRELRIRVEEHVTIESDDREQRGGAYSDIRIVERGPATATAVAEGVDIADADALQVPLDEPATQRSIHIYDTSTGDRLVTVIEIVSLANKSSSAGRELYHRKQNDIRYAGVNLVEIDLLRGSHYVLLAPFDRFPAARPDACYYVCVTRAASSMASVHCISLRESLPAIKIPLRNKDHDARLDLQPLIEQAYENGGYGDDVDYRQDPIPPLSPEDAAWADALLREKGLR